MPYREILELMASVVWSISIHRGGFIIDKIR